MGFAARGNRWAASPPSRGFRRGPAASHVLCARWPLICGPAAALKTAMTPLDLPVELGTMYWPFICFYFGPIQ